MVDHPDQAQPYLKRLVSEFPTSEFAPEALWWMFWYQTREHLQEPGKLGTALALADSGREKYPKTKAAAKLVFWSGKINELIHQKEKARLDYQWVSKNFPAYYYGHRAKARLVAIGVHGTASASAYARSSASGRADRGWSTKPGRQFADSQWHWPDVETMISTDKLEKLYGQTVAELLKLRQFDECIQELPAGTSAEFKAALYAAQGDNPAAIKAAGKTLEGKPSGSERWQMTYPRVYTADVIEASQAEHLDPFLVHALIREESRYNPLAVSSSKAIGLMQLLEGTAYGAAKKLGLHIADRADVFKPEINVKLGAHYLAYVLEKADSNALMAVASYNAGPYNVQRWWREYEQAGYKDLDVFVEDIPLRETRDYVRKVFGSYWTYEEIYPEQRLSMQG